jgi:hypothetical protein
VPYFKISAANSSSIRILRPLYSAAFEILDVYALIAPDPETAMVSPRGIACYRVIRDSDRLAFRELAEGDYSIESARSLTLTAFTVFLIAGARALGDTGSLVLDDALSLNFSILVRSLHIVPPRRQLA